MEMLSGTQTLGKGPQEGSHLKIKEIQLLVQSLKIMHVYKWTWHSLA